MGLTDGNEILLGLFDHLARNIGSTTLDVCFEDLGLRADLEGQFDGMVLWALQEGLITVMSSKNLEDAHTQNSYAVLHNPAITALGISVASVAMSRLDGNVILATAMVKNPVLVDQVERDRAASLETSAEFASIRGKGKRRGTRALVGDEN